MRQYKTGNSIVLSFPLISFLEHPASSLVAFLSEFPSYPVSCPISAYFYPSMRLSTLAFFLLYASWQTR